jgi:restriction endonuclease Mrr
MRGIPIRPQPEVEMLLIELLYERGQLRPEEAYDALASRFGLTNEERSLVTRGAKPENAWNNLVRFARRRLVDHGLVNQGPRGLWSLTAEGATSKRAKIVPL